MQRHMLLSALYGRYLRRAAAVTLKVAREAVKGLHTAKTDTDVMTDEEEKALCENLDRLGAGALWILFAERLD